MCAPQDGVVICDVNSDLMVRRRIAPSRTMWPDCCLKLKSGNWSSLSPSAKADDPVLESKSRGVLDHPLSRVMTPTDSIRMASMPMLPLAPLAGRGRRRREAKSPGEGDY